MNTLATAILAISCATVAAPVVADEQYATGRPLPELHNENGVKYMCGGIGMMEAARMKQIASDYDLMLTFASSDGAYLADIDIDIAKEKGPTLVTARCNGPIMLVDVPQPGNYRITSTTEGHRVVRTARVRDGQAGKRLAITWPASLMENPAAALR